MPYDAKKMQHSLYKPSDPIPSRWKRWFNEDKAHTSEWRGEAKAAFRFAAIQHWSESDKASLKAQMRPVMTFDRSSVVVEAISGQEIQNRQKITFLPREQGDAHANEVLSEGARWFDDEAEGADEDTEAFVDCLWCGIGVAETRLSTDDNPEGDPAVDRFDPIEFYWDKSSTKPGLSDSRRRWRVKTFSMEEAKERWPDADFSRAGGGNWIAFNDSDDGEVHTDNPEEWYGGEEGGDDDGGYSENTIGGISRKVTVAHLQYWVFEDFYQVLDPMSGQVVEMDEKKLKETNKQFEPFGMKLQSVKSRRRKFYYAFIANEVLEHDENPVPRFTWSVITGKRDRRKNTFYGLYRGMKDPQMWSNKWLSQGLHILNSSAKGGAFYETGAFVNQADAEDKWASANGLIEVEPGALQSGRVQERHPQPFPAAFQQLTEFAMQATREVVGANLEMLGQRQANQPGVLEYQRRQSGLTILAPMFNSLKRYRRDRGRIILHYLTEYMADGRLIRIGGEGQQKYVPLVKQTDARYDVIVDDAPFSPNQKEMVWQSVMHVLPGIKDIIPPPVMLQLLEYSPFPPSVVAKIKEIINAPNEEAKQKAQMAARGMMAEIGEKEASAQLKMAQAMKFKMEAGAQPDPGLAQQAQAMQMQGDMEEAMVDQSERQTRMVEQQARQRQAGLRMTTDEAQAQRAIDRTDWNKRQQDLKEFELMDKVFSEKQPQQ
tara:strand:+ start:2273 stop:4417 length:2145 start_codon:yes stop_codon:yes gene_type:complete